MEINISLVLFFSKDLPDDLKHSEPSFTVFSHLLSKTIKHQHLHKRLGMTEFLGAHLTGKYTVTRQHDMFLKRLLN